MLRGLSQLELAVAAVMLVAIVVLVFVAAILRFFDHPLIWSIDMAQLLFIWLCMIGATRAMRQKSHLGIDLAVRNLPDRARFALEAVLSLLILAFLGALVVKGVQLTLGNLQRQFGDSGISYGWVTAAVPAGAAMLALALLGNAWQAVAGRRAGRPSLIYSHEAVAPEPVVPVTSTATES